MADSLGNVRPHRSGWPGWNGRRSSGRAIADVQHRDRVEQGFSEIVFRHRHRSRTSRPKSAKSQMWQRPPKR
ncbi:MAG: hypothetical protein K0M78_02280, partial [Brevundimonas sp.]|nr:hypothetical protein [Brevundimonas sp.]